MGKRVREVEITSYGNIESPTIGIGNIPYGAGIPIRPPFTAATSAELALQLYVNLERLRPEYRNVLYLRFGLNGAYPLTQQECGMTIGKSSSWVEYLEHRALRDLRVMMLSEEERQISEARHEQQQVLRVATLKPAVVPLEHLVTEASRTHDVSESRPRSPIREILEKIKAYFSQRHTFSNLRTR